MNYESIAKTIWQKTGYKNSKYHREIAACEKKPLSRKRIFVQTPFSHSILKLELKNIHAAEPLALSLHFLFRRDTTPTYKITTPF